MERPHRDALPTLVANTKNLRQQLEQLHANVKAACDERPQQANRPDAVGMVIRGK
jgi:outer membrane murein-binding lipoprotein Lpp